MSDARRGSEEAFAKANGLELCYQTFGPDQAPAMLMIMGLGRQMVDWDDGFCESLAGRGYRVIRFDNRDSGRSSKIADGPGARYGLVDMAADAVGLLDFLGVDAAHVVGVSMGGMIAQELAIRWPTRVRSLTSILSTTGEPDLPGPAPEALPIVTASPARTPEAYLESFPRHMDVLRGPGFPRDETLDRARAERHVARGICPDGAARQRLAVQASGGRRKALNGITKPALVIHGTDDPLIPLAAGEATAEAIPRARLVVVEHMGHCLPIETWLHIVDAIDETAKAA